MRAYKSTLIMLFIGALALQACIGEPTNDASQQATLGAMEVQVQGTATTNAIFSQNPNAAVQTEKARCRRPLLHH